MVYGYLIKFQGTRVTHSCYRSGIATFCTSPEIVLEYIKRWQDTGELCEPIIYEIPIDRPFEEQASVDIRAWAAANFAKRWDAGNA